MARTRMKNRHAPPTHSRRTSMWDAVIAATTQGWSATMRLCVLLLVIVTTLVAAALLNTRLLSALTSILGS